MKLRERDWIILIFGIALGFGIGFAAGYAWGFSSAIKWGTDMAQTYLKLNFSEIAGVGFGI